MQDSSSGAEDPRKGTASDLMQRVVRAIGRHRVAALVVTLLIAAAGGLVAWKLASPPPERGEAALREAEALDARGDDWNAALKYQEAVRAGLGDAARLAACERRARCLLDAGPGLRAARGRELADQIESCLHAGQFAWSWQRGARRPMTGPPTWPPSVDLHFELAYAHAAREDWNGGIMALGGLAMALRDDRFAESGDPGERQRPDRDFVPEFARILARGRPVLEGPACPERRLLVRVLTLTSPVEPLAAEGLAWLDSGRGWSTAIVAAVVEALALKHDPGGEDSDLADLVRTVAIDGLDGELERLAASRDVPERERDVARRWRALLADPPPAPRPLDATIEGAVDVTLSRFLFANGRWSPAPDMISKRPLFPGRPEEFVRIETRTLPPARVASAWSIPGMGTDVAPQAPVASTFTQSFTVVSSFEDGRTAISFAHCSAIEESARSRSESGSSGAGPFSALYTFVPGEGGDPRQDSRILWIGRATRRGDAPPESLDDWKRALLSDLEDWCVRFEACVDANARNRLYIALQHSVRYGLGILQRLPVPEAIPSLCRFDRSLAGDVFYEDRRRRILAARIVAGDRALLDDPGFEKACDELDIFDVCPNGDATGFWAHVALVSEDERFRDLACRRLQPLAGTLDREWRLEQLRRVADARPGVLPAWLESWCRRPAPDRFASASLVERAPLFAVSALLVPMLLVLAAGLVVGSSTIGRVLRASACLVAAAVLALGLSLEIDGIDVFADLPALVLAAAGTAVLGRAAWSRGRFVPAIAFAIAAAAEGLARLGVSAPLLQIVEGTAATLAIATLPVLAGALRRGSPAPDEAPLAMLRLGTLVRGLVPAALAAWWFPGAKIHWIVWAATIGVAVWKTLRPAVGVRGGRSVTAGPIPRWFALAYAFPLLGFHGMNMLALVAREHLTLRGGWILALVWAAAGAILWALLRLARAVFRPYGLGVA